jgi:hypothetical protein
MGLAHSAVEPREPPASSLSLHAVGRSQTPFRSSCLPPLRSAPCTLLPPSIDRSTTSPATSCSCDERHCHRQVCPSSRPVALPQRTARSELASSTPYAVKMPPALASSEHRSARPPPPRAPPRPGAPLRPFQL